MEDIGFGDAVPVADDISWPTLFLGSILFLPALVGEKTFFGGSFQPRFGQACWYA
jgi:hypothetical protein